MKTKLYKSFRNWAFQAILLIAITLMGINSYAQSPLCASGPTTFGYEYISDLSINSVPKTVASSFTGGPGNLGYYDYTSSSLTTMVAGQTYPVSVTVNTNGPFQEFVKIWFDFNGNGVLSDTGEMVFDQNKSFTGTATYSGNITVPTTAFNGDIYIRVMMVFSAIPNLCGSYEFGNTVDLKATITGGLTSRKLTISTSGNGSVTSSPSGINTSSGQNSADFADGSSISLTASPVSPQIFLGWTGDVISSTNPLSVTMNAAKNITASFGVTNNSPTNIALSATSINENVAANSTVGTLSTTDPDAGNTFTYTLVAGTGSTDNASFNIIGNSLRITSSPDFETKNSYSVRVRTTDQGGLYFEKVFTITVNDLNEYATVTTQAVTAILETTATGNGNITALGSPNPTAYGVCWNTTGAPTISNSKVDKGAASATGAFTASMTGLTPNTTYYLRAYATNATGTSYGSEVSFTTLLTSLSGITGGTSIAQNTPVYIASSAIVTGATLNGAIVSISGNFASSQDILGIDGTQSGTTSSISYTYDSSKGILTLTGVADVATYQTILRKVTYTNTSATPSTDSRSITISLNKALPYSANGHYYEFVPSSGIKWTDAKTAAEGLNYFGLKGYLATITDKDENDFCTAKLSGDGWMGATDTDTEGTWKWVTGPEAGQTFSYTNWNSGQPDNYLGVEDYAQFYVTGKWNDLPNSEPSIVGYVVEYGGSVGDPTLDISDVVTVNFSVPVSTAASGIQSNSFQANWNTVSGATNYYLDVATNSSFSSILSGYSNKNVGNVTTYKVEGLNPVTTYYYRVRATSLASGYNSNTSSATTIKADQTITFNALSAKTYGDIDFSPAASASSGLTVSYTTSDPNVATITGGLIHIVGTGTCTIYADQSGDDTYNAAPQASQQLTVNKATLTATANAQTKVYGDVNPALSFKYSGWKNSETETVIDTKPIAATTVTYTTSVGTYSITISGGSDNNYSFSYVPADFAVTAATLTVTAEAKTKVYGDDNPTLTFQYSGWKNDDDDSDLDIKPVASTTVTNTTSVGTYTDVITVSGGADNNYAFSYVPADFSITAATLTATADAKTKVYGDANPPLTFKYSGWKNDDDDSDLDIKPVASTTVTNTTSVGTYTDVITVSGGADNNYAFSYVPADFSITAATLIVTADAKTKVYGDANPPLTFKYSGWKNNDDDSDLDIKPVASTTVTNTTSVGTYTDVITVSGGADNNYAFSYVPADFSITAATLTVTADAKTKVYGDDNPTLTFQYSGWKNNDDDSDLDIKPTASTTVTNTTSVGTYTDVITVSGGVDNNYAFSYVPADFEVTAATLTVTADAKTKVYGDDNPTLTFQYSGWKNDDDDSDLDIKPTASTTVTNTTSVGTYTDVITVSGGVDNNYAFSYVPADFKVTAATLTVTADAKTKGYGDDNPTLTFQYSGWKNIDDDSDLDTKPTVSTTVTNTTSVGTYTDVITVSGGADNNYAFSYVPADFEVTAATLTVTADAKTKVYGDVNPALTFKYSGWKNSDDESDLDTKPTASTTVTNTTSVGTYTEVITVSGGADNNYAFSYVPADFEITKAMLTVTADSQSKAFGAPNPSLTFQYSGWKNGETESVLNTKPTASTIIADTTPVGTYENAITVSGGSDNNYDFTYVSASFTVNKGKLVIWLDQKTKNYGDENPTLTYRYTGFMNGDDESDLDYIPYPSTSVTRYTNAGTYISSITMTGGLDDNYYIVNVPANFIVNKAPLTVKADNKTKAYGENNPDLTVTYSGWKNGESEAVLDVKPVVSTTVNATTLPGVYPNTITAQAGSDNNYKFEYVAGTFTVTQASQSIVFNALAPKTYGDEPFILSATSNSGLTISYTCINSDVIIVSGNTVNIIGAGTAVITASQSGDSNYLPAATVSQTLTVNRKPLFVAGITAASKIYDGNANAVLAGGTLSGTINSDVITLNNATSGTFSQTSVGTEIPVSTAMTISGDKVANYVLSLPNLKADITPKVIAVTAKNASRTCDQPEQALSYSFEPSLVGTDTFTGTLTRTVGNTPGVYPILQGTLSLGTNYSINFTGASYTIINTKNLAPTVDQPSNLTVLKNSKEVTVTLTGIDPVSNCMAQDIESIVATADNKNLIPEIVVDYTKGQPTAKLKLKIADGLNGETTIHVKLKDNGGTENSGTDTREISFNIKVEIPVGVEDLTQNFDVRVYPNPSKGLIKIETSGFNRPSVRIFKVTGEEIMKKMNLMDPIETMDLGGNAPGIYFVEISDQTNTITKKLILKN